MTKITDTNAKPLREGSKAATLLELLQRKDGATLEEMTERTGWQSHSLRAAMTGLRKKGHVIDKRAAGNTTAWFIGAAA
jgi:transcription initiation factor IIE alpha subunit